MITTSANTKAQKHSIFVESTRTAIKQLAANIGAPDYPAQTEVDEKQYPQTHLLREREGWKAPEPEIVRAYFEQFKKTFPEYDSDKKLATLLGLTSDRRIREFKEGGRKVPYGVWRTFLIMTGRAPQDVIKVFGYFD